MAIVTIMKSMKAETSLFIVSESLIIVGKCNKLGVIFFK